MRGSEMVINSVGQFDDIFGMFVGYLLAFHRYQISM